MKTLKTQLPDLLIIETPDFLTEFNEITTGIGNEDKLKILQLMGEAVSDRMDLQFAALSFCAYVIDTYYRGSSSKDIYQSVQTELMNVVSLLGMEFLRRGLYIGTKLPYRIENTMYGRSLVLAISARKDLYNLEVEIVRFNT